MDNGIYAALSDQIAALRDLDNTANNLANVNTTGYQASRIHFSSYLTPDGRGGTLAEAGTPSEYRVTTQGDMQSTGNPLDVAINGPGYFTVQAPQGLRYTRAGNFQLDGTGTLVTAEGYPVLDQNGQHIVFSPNDHDIVIGGAGNISVAGEGRTSLGVVEFQNPQSLTRLGGRIYASSQQPTPSANPRVVQGVLEKSNVQPVLEITRMIDIQRAISNTAQYIQVMYDLEDRAGTSWTQPVS